MKATFKNIVVAALAVAFSCAAQAGKPLPIEMASSSLTATVAQPAFQNTFEFVTSGNYLNNGSMLVAGQSNLFSSLKIDILTVAGDSLFGPISGTVSNGQIKASFADSAFAGSLLANTTYKLKVFGQAADAGNSFSVNSLYISSIKETVPAVPEPETYAMMLAGLGLIGGIALRRSRRG